LQFKGRVRDTFGGTLVLTSRPVDSEDDSIEAVSAVDVQVSLREVQFDKVEDRAPLMSSDKFSFCLSITLPSGLICYLCELKEVC
jgi:hypothetical protein